MIVWTHHTQCACLPHRSFSSSSSSSPPVCPFVVSRVEISLSGGVSIGAVSIRASASLSSLLPPNDWREEEEEGARLHYQHTHTHTGYITLWKQCGSSGKSIRDGFPPLSPFFSSCFMTFCFYPSAPDQLWGCILKHEGGSPRRVLSRLSVKTVFSSSCTSISYLFHLQTVFWFLSAYFFLCHFQGRRRSFSTGPPRKYLSHF